MSDTALSAGHMASERPLQVPLEDMQIISVIFAGPMISSLVGKKSSISSLIA